MEIATFYSSKLHQKRWALRFVIAMAQALKVTSIEASVANQQMIWESIEASLC